MPRRGRAIGTRGETCMRPVITRSLLSVLAVGACTTITTDVGDRDDASSDTGDTAAEGLIDLAT